MGSEFEFVKRLNFDDIDLIAPEDVFKDILSRLQNETKGIVQGNVKEYLGYVKSRFGSFFSSKEYAETRRLGAQGEKRNLFEFYLSTGCYQNYKFRVCFFEYGLGRYPVQLIVEEDVADDINMVLESDNVFICETRKALKEMILKMLNTKRVLTIMQELIRINQIYKENPQYKNNSDNIPF
ncbi:hypothetical protein [uncultured Bacteroides sp.]|uniref:hypothetical protein n=1 Tax=uncultured Bacteroides sp. TaxID=162156 RepID=UPI00260476E1|nr:hypothetical protein [uncultured Bacteroides sp.]